MIFCLYRRSHVLSPPVIVAGCVYAPFAREVTGEEEHTEPFLPKIGMRTLILVWWAGSSACDEDPDLSYE